MGKSMSDVTLRNLSDVEQKLVTLFDTYCCNQETHNLFCSLVVELERMLLERQVKYQEAALAAKRCFASYSFQVVQAYGIQLPLVVNPASEEWRLLLACKEALHDAGYEWEEM